MIKHGQPYRYDVYPPLHTGSCPGCGARLSRDEVQLWGSLSAPRLGLPDMEFPLCAQCQPLIEGDPENLLARVSLSLNTTFLLASEHSFGPADDGDPVFHVRWLNQGMPWRPDVTANRGSFPRFQFQPSDNPEGRCLRVRWGEDPPGPFIQAQIYFVPSDEMPESMMEAPPDLPFVSGLALELFDEVRTAIEWTVEVAYSGQDVARIMGMPAFAKLGERLREPLYFLWCRLGGSDWHTGFLPRKDVRRADFADEWLRKLCTAHRELTGLDVPIELAANFYALLRFLSRHSPDKAKTFNQAMWSVSPVYHQPIHPRLIGEPVLNSAAVTQRAETALRHDDPETCLPVGTFNRLRVLHRMADRLWRRDMLMELARRRREKGEEWRNAIEETPLPALAVLGWMYQQTTADGLAVGVGETRLRLDESITEEQWLQLIELLAWPSPSAAGIEFLYPGLHLPGVPNLIAKAYLQVTDVGEEQADEVLEDLLGSNLPFPEAVGQMVSGAKAVVKAFPSDRTLAFAVMQGQLEDAETHRRYIPVGGYRVFLPAGLALREFFGITALRVWFEPECSEPGMWVRLEAEDDEGMVWWWALQAPRRNTGDIPEFGWPLMAATLAALYRDLCVAGETVIVETATAAASAPRHALPGNNHKRRRHARRRDMPGRRYEVQGYPARNVQWGDDAEVERVRRLAHHVRGHLRQMPEGRMASPAAVERGRQYRLIPPVGYTFVRPHVRGMTPEAGDGASSSGDESLPQVRAKGLYTLMALLSEAAPLKREEERD